VARTEGFMLFSKEYLPVGSLLDDDGLKSTREKAVFNAVVWILKPGGYFKIF
jgi:hypothetical protein